MNIRKARMSRGFGSKMSIDMHMHSVYSDGAWTPAELVRDAKEKQLSVISLTDHDTIAGLCEARKQAELAGIQFVDGVEINSFYRLGDKRINIHVLGYLFYPNRLEPYMMRLKKVRDEHNEAIRKALSLNSIEICCEDMDLPSEHSMVNRLYFAEVLVRKGYAKNVKEALARYLRKGGIAYVEGNYPSFREVARKIKEAGGLVILAHPGEYSLIDEDAKCLINELMLQGLDGVECIHPSHSKAYAEKVMGWAKERDLIMTGGSDFHSMDGAVLGRGGDGMRIPQSFYDKLALGKIPD